MRTCERCGTFAETLQQRGRLELCVACVARLKAPLYPYFYSLLVGILTNPAIALYLLSRNAAALGDQALAKRLRTAALYAVVALVVVIALPVPLQLLYAGAAVTVIAHLRLRDRLFVQGAPRPSLALPVVGALAMGAALFAGEELLVRL